MRILHVTSCETGGVPRAMEMLAAATPMHEHHVAWPGHAGPETAFFREHRLSSSKFRAFAELRHIIERVKPDLVHAHSSWGGLFARAHKQSVPIVYQPHCFAFEGSVTPGLLRWGFKFAEKLLAGRTTAFVALTVRERDLALSVGAKRVVVVPNVSTIPRFGPQDQANISHPVVSMVGRISPQKSPDFFCDVSRLVSRVRPEVRFRWVGDGVISLRDQLLRAGVEVTGWVDDDQLRSELLATSLYVHVADYEGFPLSVLDAAAMNVPVIVRTIPAFDGSGLLCGDTPREVASLILSLLDNPDRLQAAKVRGDSLLDAMNMPAMQAAAEELYEVARRAKS